MKHLIRIILFMILVGVSLPTYAQDVPSQATQEATGEPVVEGPVVINVNGSENAPVDNSLVGYIALGLSAVIGVVVSVSLALQVIGNRAQAISNNPAVLATLEQGYEASVPDIIKAALDPLKESLERSDKALVSVLDLVKKLTDGVPEASKPVPPTPAAPTSLSGTPAAYVTDSTHPNG